jgi:asparagine N-glycosylation enzyme membrane subunit Stt3
MEGGLPVQKIKRLTTAFTVVLLIEAAATVIAFFLYAKSWQEASFFIGLLLLPVIFLTGYAWRRLRSQEFTSSKSTALLAIAWCLGTAGMLMALVAGAHVAASFLLIAGYLQSALTWFALK